MVSSNSDILDWLSSKVSMPTVEITDIVAVAAGDLITTLQNLASEPPLQKLHTNLREELVRMANIFAVVAKLHPIDNTQATLPRVQKAAKP